MKLSPPDSVGTTVYRRVLFALLAMDLLFIGVYVVLSVMARADWLIQEVPGTLDISEDHGLPESFNYAKWLVIVICLAATFRRTRVPLFASLATIFLLVLLDDSLGIHEQVGDRLEKLTGWDQLGELIAFAGLGMISLFVLVPGLWNLPRAVWPLAVRFIGVLLGLVLCGVVIDFAHASIDSLGLPMGRLSDRVLGLVEDGGEMLLASLATAYGVAVWRWAVRVSRGEQAAGGRLTATDVRHTVGRHRRPHRSRGADDLCADSGGRGPACPAALGASERPNGCSSCPTRPTNFRQPR
jgi:hypothetical protein